MCTYITRLSLLGPASSYVGTCCYNCTRNPLTTRGIYCTCTNVIAFSTAFQASVAFSSIFFVYKLRPGPT